MRSRRRDGRRRAANGTALVELGLSAGDRVRFRRREGGRWRQGTVSGMHKDGSVAMHDEDSRARAISRPTAKTGASDRRNSAFAQVDGF
ncbi:MAG TPA: hypothetical protein VGR16_09685 [Thermomicrobiales bacterium]|nr:hypothetical protein [Thermomicrobiales bacterium]